MSSGFTLVPLDCPSCGAGLAAEGDDVVFYCTACRNGYRFDPEDQRLHSTEVSFVACAHEAFEVFRPFWLLPARITMRERRAKGAGFSGLMEFFFGGSQEGRPEAEGTFVVPAFDLPLALLTALSRRYTEALPDLGEKLGERLLGGRYGAVDARKLAHYVLIASEVAKADTLTRLDYHIEFGEARLLGVPFRRRDGQLVDAVFGLPAGEG